MKLRTITNEDGACAVHIRKHLGLVWSQKISSIIMYSIIVIFADYFHLFSAFALALALVIRRFASSLMFLGLLNGLLILLAHFQRLFKAIG